MADILIRKVDAATKAILKQRAARRGRSLEADLREALERLAHEEAGTPDETEPFGSWLVSITRPGVDLSAKLRALRAAPARPVDLD